MRETVSASPERRQVDLEEALRGFEIQRQARRLRFASCALPPHPIIRSVTRLPWLSTIPFTLSKFFGSKVLFVEAAIEGSLCAVIHRYQLLVIVETDGAVRTAFTVLPPIDVLVFVMTLYVAHHFL